MCRCDQPATVDYGAGQYARRGRHGVRTERGDARAELRIGDQRIALAAGTEISLAMIDDRVTQIAVRRGRVGFEARRLDNDETVEIDVPRGGIWLLAAGRYDIDAGNDTAPTRVATFDGRARFVGNSDDSLIATSSVAVLGGGEPLFAEFKPAVSDDFAEWWRSLGTGDRILPAMLHISPAMTGIEALDGSGHWEAVAGEDSVWGPIWFADAVPDDWAPYRYGRWRWIQPWGWTWIDDAAWGFAPSHYGRWARFPRTGSETERWGWIPGKPVDDPAYAPAVVAFLGTAGVGLSYADANGPAFAWFPLAPGEVYRPTFTRDIAAIRQLNAGCKIRLRSRQPTRIMRRDEIVGAEHHNRRFASAVPRAAFLAGQPVPPALVQIPESRLEQAPLITDAAPFPAAPAPPTPRAVAASPVRAKIVAAAAAAHVAATSSITGARQKIAGNQRGITRAPVARPVAVARAVIPRRNCRATSPKSRGACIPHHAAMLG